MAQQQQQPGLNIPDNAVIQIGPGDLQGLVQGAMQAALDAVGVAQGQAPNAAVGDAIQVAIGDALPAAANALAAAIPGAVAAAGGGGGGGVGPGSKRATTFESGDKLEWAAWVRDFHLTVQINHWDNQRARREAARAMKGRAYMATAHIDIAAVPPPGGVAADIEDYHLLIEEYEAVFVPPAETDAAIATYERDRMDDTEDLQGWHGMNRYNFRQAYPHTPAAEVANNRGLIFHFITGIPNSEVRRLIWMARPNNYAAALAAAQTAISGFKLENKTAMGSNGASATVTKREIMALGRPAERGRGRGGRAGGPENRRCFHCNEVGHLKMNCPSFREERGRSRGRGGFRGGFRGTGRGGRGRGGNSFRSRSGQFRGTTADQPGVHATSNPDDNNPETEEKTGEWKDYEEDQGNE